MNVNLYAIRENTLKDIQKLQDKRARIDDELKSKAQKLYLVNEDIKKQEKTEKWAEARLEAKDQEGLTNDEENERQENEC